MKTKLTLLGCLLALAVGCRNEPTELQPAVAGGGEDPPPAATLSEQDSGVRLVAEADGWTGWQPIQRQVTPLRVRIHNEGAEPIVVRYDAFVVRGEDPQQSYGVVPPMTMDQEVETYMASNAYGPIADPYYDHDAFSVAPYYAGVYPSMGVYDDYAFDAGYYNTWDGYWVDTELPTEQMLERVMPEGVIEPGGQVEGVLFFQHVPASTAGAMLHAALRSAVTDEVVASFEIPLVVENEEDA